ncbi:MAG: quinolinate synthase NadA [Candidatus Omnitrophica bacterium]|nr:quinolinate synthase NadA [Candidatus Omnitrophota bacterium]MDD5430191.1 quinolinate synthase NadA [Candidatus Omnitrophota bacterium]
MDNLQKKIVELKKEKKAVILAHNYQIPQIQEIADFLGDSLELARISRKLKERIIVLCGVRFMAETVKILSPEKKVILPVMGAGCPMADMITREDILKEKTAHPGAWVVSYVNTSAEVKAVSDVCCTSSNAVKVVENVPVDKVIFVPDKNLGWWVEKNVPGKKIFSWQGYCLVHEEFSLKDLEESKKLYPEAEVIVHPECRREILERADYVMSTSGMLKRAKESKSTKFIIGTEEGMIYRLKKENPAKEFCSLGTPKVCVNMKKTTLQDVYHSLESEKYNIEIDPVVIEKASLALERMVSYI